MQFDATRWLIAAALYLVGCYACWRIIRALNEPWFLKFKGWATGNTPATQPPIATKNRPPVKSSVPIAAPHVDVAPPVEAAEQSSPEPAAVAETASVPEAVTEDLKSPQAAESLQPPASDTVDRRPEKEISSEDVNQREPAIQLVGGARPAEARVARQRAFATHTKELHKRWRTHGESYCVVRFDLDGIESWEEDDARPVSEELSQCVIDQVCRAVDEQSVVAETHDGKLIVFMRQADLADGKHLGENIRRTVASSPCRVAGREVNATVSGGVAAVSGSDTTQDVIQRADEALCEARTLGRDRVYYHDGERCRPVWRTGDHQRDLAMAGGSPRATNTGGDLTLHEPRGLLRESQPIAGFQEVDFETNSFLSGWEDTANLLEAKLEQAAIDDELRWTEKRAAARIPLCQHHPIAPYRDGTKPRPSDFQLVRCRDISKTGFSFYIRHAPKWDYLVVKLLGRSLIATIVHRTKTVGEEGEIMYIVGCSFSGKLENDD